MGHSFAQIAVEAPAASLAPGSHAADGTRHEARAMRGLAGHWAWRCTALTAAYVAVAYVVSTAIALPLHWPLAHMIRQAQGVILLTYLPLLLATLADSFVGPRARAGKLRGFLFSPRFALEFAAAMIAVHVTLMVFVNLKQYVPALNERLYDSPLWRLEEQLHFGVQPAVFASDTAAALGLMPWLDHAYLIFFPVQLVVPLLFLMSARLRPQRGRFFFAYCLLWMVGGAVYILWPALGPCYYRGARFPWLELAPFAQQLQGTLIRDYAQFRFNPAYYEVKLYYGVAALPSLHVAVIALFAMATSRWRPLSVALWVLTGVTFVGSLALAWHYAVDGYLGLALAAACWWIGRRLVAEVKETSADATDLAGATSR